VGFSPWGLAVSVAVLAPNLILVWWPPRTPLPDVRIPIVWRVLERAGQALCLVVPAITVPGPLAWGWSIVVAAAVGGYYGLWARYLATGWDGVSLYSSVLSVPVPMAVLPVLAFLATALWLSNPWIAVAAVVLAVGHIPSAVRIARAVTDRT